jgi:hypothetical protein
MFNGLPMVFAAPVINVPAVCYFMRVKVTVIIALSTKLFHVSREAPDAATAK